MTDLPSGTVAFVLTDIEHSTRLLRQLGEQYGDVLERHRDLLRSTWQRHGGHEVDNQGDSCFAVFGRTSDAVDACARAQAALRSQPWPQQVAVRVRMGVHSGLAAPLRGRYVAMAVHQAARVANLAHGGQVVVSEQAVATLDRSRSKLLSPLGRYQVRDFDRPVSLYQLAAPGPPETFPALRALPADRHNLMAPVEPLVNREADLAGLEAALDEHRLVTLVGFGGVGKTRLATEAGIRRSDRVEDGVWLVECAPQRDAAGLRSAIAAGLGVSLEPVGGSWEDLLAELARSRALVILDGCERHVATGRGVVSSLLAACPGIRLLITSTEPLGVAGEVVRRLPPLATAAGAGSAAVELFMQRASAVRSVADDESTSATVVAICQRLDGLPLALEIAAAKTTVLHVTEILAGLNNRFRLLRERGGSRPARHQAIESLLDWSFELLAPEEATALSRLSLFAAGFSLASATAAVAQELLVADPVIESDAVPELVWSLVEKSLVIADPAAGGTRYRLLETVRAYAAQQLSARAETGSCAARLARFYLDRLGPVRGTARPWVAAVGLELPNLRHIIAVVADTDQAAAQELAVTIARYHDAVQTFRNGIDEVTGWVSALPAATPARVGLLTALSDLHARVGDTAAADAYATAAHRLRAETGDPGFDEVGVAKAMGEVALLRGEPAAAVTIARAALAGRLSPRGRARMNNLLGIALATQGRYETAAEAFSHELAAATELGDEVLLAHAQSNAAEIWLRLGDLRAAARHQRIAMTLALALGQSGMLGYALLATARIAAHAVVEDEQDWATATRLAAKAQDLLTESGIALYDTDVGVTRVFLDEARQRLGEVGFRDAQAAGRALEIEAAMRLAEGVLTVTEGGPHAGSEGVSG